MRKVLALLAVLAALVCASTERADAGRCPVVVDRTLSYAIGIAVVPAVDGVSGAHAFTGSGEVLKVVDVSDPAHPVLAGRLALQETITAIAARENYLYVWTGTRRFNVIDAQVPEDPQLVGWVDLEDVILEFPTIEVAGNHVYISPDLPPWGFLGIDHSQGIRVIDVSNPDAPEEVARVEGTYDSFAISGSTLSALTNEVDAGWRIDLFDISHPMDPTPLGSYHGPQEVWGREIMTDGSFVYVVSSDGLEIIDVSDRAEPVRAGATDLPGWLWNFGLSDGRVYAHASAHFEAIDVRDPHNPIHCGNCETPWTYGQPAAMAFSEGLAYISNAYQGLVVVDIGDPSNPAVVGQLVEGSGEDVAVAGRFVVRLQTQGLSPLSFSRLQITDPGTPDGPTEIGRYEIDWGSPSKIAVHWDSVYVMSRGGGIEEVDISDPSEPQLVGRIQTAFYLSDIAVTDNFAYLAVDRLEARCHGLQILDVAQPDRFEADAARYRDYLEICDVGSPLSIAVSGAHAFLGTESALVVIDVSDPFAPYEVARVETPAADIAIRGSYAYVAAAQLGLRIYDIRVPTAPQPVGELALPETTWGPDEAVAITVAGRRAYLGSHLQAIDISDPTRPSVLWDYPRGSNFTLSYLEFVTDVAAAGDSAFLVQSWLGSTILDISGCREPRRDSHRPGSENP